MSDPRCGSEQPLPPNTCPGPSRLIPSRHRTVPGRSPSWCPSGRDAHARRRARWCSGGAQCVPVAVDVQGDGAGRRWGHDRPSFMVPECRGRSGRRKVRRRVRWPNSSLSVRHGLAAAASGRWTESVASARRQGECVRHRPTLTGRRGSVPTNVSSAPVESTTVTCGPQPGAEDVGAHHSDHRRRAAHAGRGHRLVGTLAAGDRTEPASDDGLAPRGLSTCATRSMSVLPSTRTQVMGAGPPPGDSGMGERVGKSPRRRGELRHRLAVGPAGGVRRSSRPLRNPNRTPMPVEQRVLPAAEFSAAASRPFGQGSRSARGGTKKSMFTQGASVGST